MKVLISAGGKTQAIIDKIESKLSSGGVDFVIVPFIENIEDIYQRGEWFDRAIILEQSWSHDYTDTDVSSMRMRINEFANQSADRGVDNINFVFLTQEETTASQIFEEILPIQINSVVLIKKPKYKVSFMVELVTTEIDRFPSDIVYRPKFEDEIQVQSELEQPATEEQQHFKINYGDGFVEDTGIYNGNGLPVSPSEPMQPDFSDSDDPFNWGEPVGEQPLPQHQSQVNWAPTPDPVPTAPYGGAGPVPGYGPSYPTSPQPQPPVQPQAYDNYNPVGQYDGTESFEEPPVFQPGLEQSFEQPGFTPDGGMPGMAPEELPGEQEVWGQEQMGDGEQLRSSDFDPYQQGQGSVPTPGMMAGAAGAAGVAQQLHQSGEIPDYSYDEPSVYNQSGEVPDYSQPEDGGLYGQSGEIPDFTQQDTSGMGYDPEGLYSQQEGQSGYDQYNPELDEAYPQGYQQPSDMEMGYGGRNVAAPTSRKNIKLDLNRGQIRSLLDAFANRGNSIVITGCGGCGTSTIALNLATIINNLGYTVLLVDLDTKNKAQSYITKGNFDSLEADSAGLLAAINSSSGINAHTAIVQTGFHLLTMGMNSEPFDISKMVQKDKIARFINLAKTSHNFVIYDIPFEIATGFGKDFTFMADNIVMSVDCSNWGITKAMLSMCNIEDADMQETLFNRGQLLFNRYRAMHKVMGRKVKTAMDITKVMDYKVRELEGDDPGLYFQQMHICGLINEDPKFENGWYDNIQFADTPAGSKIFVEILKNIVLKA